MTPEIKKTIKKKESYEIECPRCSKVVEGMSVKQVRHNFRMHELFCNKEKEKNE